MMVVRVSTEPELTPSKPEVLFEGRFADDPFGGDARNYDIAPDGKRFVMVPADAEEEPLDELRFVVNWFEELKRLVPTEN